MNPHESKTEEEIFEDFLDRIIAGESRLTYKELASIFEMSLKFPGTLKSFKSSCDEVLLRKIDACLEESKHFFDREQELMVEKKRLSEEQFKLYKANVDFVERISKETERLDQHKVLLKRESEEVIDKEKRRMSAEIKEITEELEKMSANNAVLQKERIALNDNLRLQESLLQKEKEARIRAEEALRIASELEKKSQIEKIELQNQLKLANIQIGVQAKQIESTRKSEQKSKEDFRFLEERRDREMRSRADAEKIMEAKIRSEESQKFESWKVAYQNKENLRQRQIRAEEQAKMAARMESNHKLVADRAASID